MSYFTQVLWMSLGLGLTSGPLFANDVSQLPIADVHVHYSHDSVEMTPPARVIELMENANIKFALVSSSDDNGTQLLSELAPDLIIPGLRPYRRRGELGTWFTDPDALAYVERLLEENRYATIGEFHLYGETADLPIPRRIVELADQHNLILHAHSDAEAVNRLLAQSDTVKVIWAHSGFDEPGEVADMLRQHDRLYADLAFRGEVGSGGSLSAQWIELFTEFPDRMMLGTDTYTPERMYYLPEHAEGARVWLGDLPFELAERVAWKNAYELLTPVWQANRGELVEASLCDEIEAGDINWMTGEHFKVRVEPLTDIKVSQAFSAKVNVCGELGDSVGVEFDATMPMHGHGMNYDPEVSQVSGDETAAEYQVDGLVFHMPGSWQWKVKVIAGDRSDVLTQKVELR